MTGAEFAANYVMHDSLIENVEAIDGGAGLVLTIDFAFRMQRGYRDADPETGAITVTFQNVKSYDLPRNVLWDEISILETTERDGTVTFVLLNERTDDVAELKVEADAVDVTAVGLPK